MRTLKLRLDDLTIDSFDTTPVQKSKGTVFGEQCTCYTNCTCPGCPTCYASCNGTCDASCNGTCGASCYDTCGFSCNGTCGKTCNCTFDGCGETYDYTCSGYATSPREDYICVFC